MSGAFAFLFLISLVALIWGLISPQRLGKKLRLSRQLTRKHTGMIFGSLVLLSLILGGITAPPQPTGAKNTNQTKTVQLENASPSPKAPASSTITKQIVTTQDVPFTTTNQNDASLPKGQTKVVTTGKNGTETLTYHVTYTNGQETNRRLAQDVVTTQPVNQVVSVGTYVAPPPVTTTPAAPTNCTNGTYINSAGNRVCSPEYTQSAPAGATAQCRDGSYSFSQSRSGTCSHHGGVAVWL